MFPGDFTSAARPSVGQRRKSWPRAAQVAWSAPLSIAACIERCPAPTFSAVGTRPSPAAFMRALKLPPTSCERTPAVAIDCAAVGIDSQLTPVLILADALGRDLKVNRTGGIIDFTPPADGTYLIKVNDLTFQGGERHFYRLALQNAPAQPQPQTQTVSAMSWPPAGLSALAAAKEAEPNNKAGEAQKISLPCDVSGAFFPAADVDTYEFTAKKGEVWWVEVASERFGLNTDPFVLVQQVKGDQLTDVAELYDIVPPMKVTSNGYSYDGPPYDAGSPDVNGKLEIKEDGTYRLQVRDLFGGTRSNAKNIYRLIIRKAAPDFALVAWAFDAPNGPNYAQVPARPSELPAGFVVLGDPGDSNELVGRETTIAALVADAEIATRAAQAPAHGPAGRRARCRATLKRQR